MASWFVVMTSSCGKDYWLRYDPIQTDRTRRFMFDRGSVGDVLDAIDRASVFNSREAAEAAILEYGSAWSGGQLQVLDEHQKDLRKWAWKKFFTGAPGHQSSER